MLGCITKNINQQLKGNNYSPQSALVKLQLEYHAQLWVPQCKRNNTTVVEVQQKAAEMITRLKHTRPEERLEKVGLFNVENHTATPSHYLKDDSREDGPRPFLEVHSKKTQQSKF